VLRTIAGAAAQESPADLHIYGIDCGTGALLPLAGLPHCGAVVSRDQQDRMERLLATLRGEILRRQQLLAARGFAGLAEQRAAASADARLPWMLLLFDWWRATWRHSTDTTTAGSSNRSCRSSARASGRLALRADHRPGGPDRPGLHRL